MIPPRATGSRRVKLTDAIRRASELSETVHEFLTDGLNQRHDTGATADDPEALPA